MTRKSWDEYFLGIACAAAERATCPRRHVGAILVVDKQVWATGYNGAQSGAEHCEDVGCWVHEGHCIRVIHAEMNALRQWINIHGSLPSDGQPSVTMYSTLEPCPRCRKELDSYFKDIKYVWKEDYEQYLQSKS